MSDPQRPHGLQPTRLLHPWGFPGKSSGVGCHCLLRPVILSTFKLFYADSQLLHLPLDFGIVLFSDIKFPSTLNHLSKI